MENPLIPVHEVLGHRCRITEAMDLGRRAALEQLQRRYAKRAGRDVASKVIREMVRVAVQHKQSPIASQSTVSRGFGAIVYKAETRPALRSLTEREKRDAELAWRAGIVVG